ncbi:D-galactosyl-beta-1-4-L-rhamnose phosphorylase, partial [Gemmiger formicilis]|uniref:1,3-beta-galactosyl-N-acetylhexosamine phosphorylase N-terminal domain-containing protein n=1 Tax=Gemmiger formicilis TaxID=745368 RepID=UPI001E1065B4
IGFDGIIKCVFSGYEARMCAGVPAKVHELRLHPYLFPVGLGGAPTFAPGGNPTRDAKEYWNHVRRALLRAKIDRIGLGGYLHLLEDFPDFVQYIADLADEFREVRDLHTEGEVYTLPLTVAVLHSWGSLRPWTLSGHFHETYMHDLIHINEALSGLPVHTRFLSFADVKAGKLDGV